MEVEIVKQTQMVLWPQGNQRPIDYITDKSFPWVSPSDWCGEWVNAVMT